MKTEDKIEEGTADAAAAEPVEPKPRKLLLTKRVLRHFNVRSGVQTGMDDSDGACCGHYRPTSVYYF